MTRVGFLFLKALSFKNKLERDVINKLIAYMKPLLVNATDRNTINTENYQFYFNKLLTLNNTKVQNGVLTKKKITANWPKNIGGILGGLGALFML